MRNLLVCWAICVSAAMTFGQTVPPENSATINFPATPKFPSTWRSDPTSKVSAPKPIIFVDPTYPEQARKENLSVSLLVKMVVDENGVPTNVVVGKPQGNGFDEAAIAAVKRWRFEPAMRDGKPVPVIVQTVVDFRLY